jgi:hypothetical protein
MRTEGVRVQKITTTLLDKQTTFGENKSIA